jgi:hypothetical protein
MFRTILGLGKRGHAEQCHTASRARVKVAYRLVPQLEALEDRYVPSLIGSPDFSHPGQVWFNFDSQPNDVYTSASFGLLGSTTTVEWWNGFDWSSFDVYFNPMFEGGDPTIVLNMGINPDSVTIMGNANAILVNGFSTHETVHIGNWLGNLQDNRNTITVTNLRSTDLTIDDSGDPAARTATMTDTSVTGLAPATIKFIQGNLASLTISGGSGNNTFTVADTPTSGWSGFKTTLVNNVGTDTFTLQKTTGPVEIDSGNGTNTLVGPTTLVYPALTSWQINGPNQGTVTAPVFGSPVQFVGQPSAIQNLTRGSAGNIFTFMNAGYLNGSINGATGFNILDYSNYSSNVVVNLQAGFATGVGGVSGIQKVVGSNVAGPGAYNLLIGASGAMLQGGWGRRNILVAGTSHAFFVGRDADDLIIAGSTIYDTAANLPFWLQIANYWAGADAFLTRVSNLMTGNGVPLLDKSTVIGNGGGNVLQGKNELALIFSDGKDTLNLDTFNAGSKLFTISP